MCSIGKRKAFTECHEIPFHRVVAHYRGRPTALYIKLRCVTLGSMVKWGNLPWETQPRQPHCVSHVAQVLRSCWKAYTEAYTPNLGLKPPKLGCCLSFEGRSVSQIPPGYAASHFCGILRGANKCENVNSFSALTFDSLILKTLLISLHCAGILKIMIFFIE